MPTKLDRRVGRLERARPTAKAERPALDVSMLSPATIEEMLDARRDDGTIALDKLSDTALAELEAAVIAQRGLADET